MVASSLAQPDLLHNSISPHCKLSTSFPSTTAHSLSLLQNRFPFHCFSVSFLTFFAVQFTSSNTHQKGSPQLPLHVCSVLASLEWTVPPGDLHQDLLFYDCFRGLTSLPAHYLNWQPAAIPAPGKQTCKGKRCEGKEQTSPGVRGHMALPHVTEGLCRRTSSQGDSVLPCL